MFESFEVFVVGKRHIIRKRDYPRYKAFIDFTNTLPQIREIVFLDECTTISKAIAIRELHRYILEQQNKEKNKGTTI